MESNTLERIEKALAEIEQDAISEKDGSALGYAPCVVERLRLIAALRVVDDMLDDHTSIMGAGVIREAIAKALTGEGEK